METCPHCSGFGRVKFGDKYRKCFLCGGSGFIKPEPEPALPSVQGVEELADKLKKGVIDDLLRNPTEIDKPFLAVGRTGYTKRTLAEAIKNNNAVGIDTLCSLIMLSADQVSRGKKELPSSQPASRVDVSGLAAELFKKHCHPDPDNELAAYVRLEDINEVLSSYESNSPVKGEDQSTGNLPKNCKDKQRGKNNACKYPTGTCQLCANNF